MANVLLFNMFNIFSQLKLQKYGDSPYPWMDLLIHIRLVFLASFNVKQFHPGLDTHTLKTKVIIINHIENFFYVK